MKMDMQKQKLPLIRVFISSPGDVQIEREIAKSVIAKLSNEYSRFAEIQSILWEDLPLTTANTFQEGINVVLNEGSIDIAIFILANRLGSCPGNNLRYPDGRVYRSGTEYEYDFMKKMRQDSGKPEIIVYVRKKSLGNLKFQTKEKIIEAFDQQELVNHFIQEEFEDRELGAYKAYHIINENVNFESRLTEHLRKMLQKVLGSPEIPHYKGNPYKGLLSFEPENAAIFFGRGLQLQLVKSKIIDFFDETCAVPFIFICGESGSGKSSFAKAGLVQGLLQTGIIESHKSAVRIFTPQHTNGKFCKTLLNYLKELLPSLQGNKYFNSLYEAENISEQDVAIIDEAIRQNSTETQKFMPSFLIDQFEEFFSDSRISPQEREKSIALLSALQKMGKIMVIFTLRSDFYHYVTSHKQFLEIKNAAVIYDIVHLSPRDLQEVIEEPARAAGLQWEKDTQSGESLNDTVFNEALRLQSLPLLEFALSNLYENKKGNLLTYDFYRKSGGLQGAIESYADKIFNNFTAKQKDRFYTLLGMSVTLMADGQFCRYNAVEKEFTLSAEDKEVLEILIKNRLFVRSTTPDGQTCFSIAHEFLLHRWQVARHWCEQEKEVLEKINLVKTQAVYWEKNKKNKSSLLSSKQEIEDAENLLLIGKNRLPESLKNFLTSSIKAQHQKWKWPVTIFCSILLILRLLIDLALWRDWTVVTAFFKIDTTISSTPLMTIGNYLIFALPLFLKLDSSILYRRKIKSTILLTLFTIVIMLCTFDNYQIGGTKAALGTLLIIPIFILAIGINLFTYRQYKLVENRKRKTSKVLIISFFDEKILTSFFILIAISCFCSVMNKLYSNKPAIELQNLILACDNNWGYEVNKYVIERRKNYLINNGPTPFSSPEQVGAYHFTNYQYALACYQQGLLEEALQYGFGKNLQNDIQRQLYFSIQKELGQATDDIMNWFYSSSQIPIDIRIYTALKYGNILQAARLASAWKPPYANAASKQISPLFQYSIPLNSGASSSGAYRELLNYAHCLLLLKQDIKSAAAIYNRFINTNTYIGNLSWSEALLMDLAELKKNKSFRKLISNAEKKIALSPLPISLEEGVDIKKIPQLCGSWHLENVSEYSHLWNASVRLKITPEKPIPVYLETFQNFSSGEKLIARQWFHLKVNSQNKDFLFELHNPRQESIDLWEVSFADNNTINVKIIFSLNKHIFKKTLKFKKCTCHK